MKKPVILAFLAVFGCLAFAFSGEEAGKEGDLISKAFGIWHCEVRNPVSGKKENHFLEITETSFWHEDALKRKGAADATLEEEDDAVVIRHADTERKAWDSIYVKDQNTIATWLPVLGYQKMTRVTAEFRAETLQKEKELIEARSKLPDDSWKAAASSLGTIDDAQKNGWFR